MAARIINQNGGRGQQGGIKRALRRVARDQNADLRGRSLVQMLLKVLHELPADEQEAVMLKMLNEPAVFKNLMDRVDGPVPKQVENTGEVVIRVVDETTKKEKA